MKVAAALAWAQSFAALDWGGGLRKRSARAELLCL